MPLPSVEDTQRYVTALKAGGASDQDILGQLLLNEQANRGGPVPLSEVTQFLQTIPGIDAGRVSAAAAAFAPTLARDQAAATTRSAVEQAQEQATRTAAAQGSSRTSSMLGKQTARPSLSDAQILAAAGEAFARGGFAEVERGARGLNIPLGRVASVFQGAEPVVRNRALLEASRSPEGELSRLITGGAPAAPGGQPSPTPGPAGPPAPASGPTTLERPGGLPGPAEVQTWLSRFAGPGADANAAARRAVADLSRPDVGGSVYQDPRMTAQFIISRVPREYHESIRGAFAPIIAEHERAERTPPPPTTVTRTGTTFDTGGLDLGRVGGGPIPQVRTRGVETPFSTPLRTAAYNEAVGNMRALRTQTNDIRTSFETQRTAQITQINNAHRIRREQVQGALAARGMEGAVVENFLVQNVDIEYDRQRQTVLATLGGQELDATTRARQQAFANLSTLIGQEAAIGQFEIGQETTAQVANQGAIIEVSRAVAEVQKALAVANIQGTTARDVAQIEAAAKVAAAELTAQGTRDVADATFWGNLMTAGVSLFGEPFRNLLARALPNIFGRPGANPGGTPGVPPPGGGTPPPLPGGAPGGGAPGGGTPPIPPIPRGGPGTPPPPPGGPTPPPGGPTGGGPGAAALPAGLSPASVEILRNVPNAGATLTAFVAANPAVNIDVAAALVAGAEGSGIAPGALSSLLGPGGTLTSQGAQVALVGSGLAPGMASGVVETVGGAFAGELAGELAAGGLQLAEFSAFFSPAGAALLAIPAFMLAGAMMARGRGRARNAAANQRKNAWDQTYGAGSFDRFNGQVAQAWENGDGAALLRLRGQYNTATPLITQRTGVGTWEGANSGSDMLFNPDKRLDRIRELYAVANPEERRQILGVLDQMRGRARGSTTDRWIFRGTIPVADNRDDPEPIPPPGIGLARSREVKAEFENLLRLSGRHWIRSSEGTDRDIIGTFPMAYIIVGAPDLLAQAQINVSENGMEMLDSTGRRRVGSTLGTLPPAAPARPPEGGNA